LVRDLHRPILGRGVNVAAHKIIRNKRVVIKWHHKEAGGDIAVVIWNTDVAVKDPTKKFVRIHIRRARRDWDSDGILSPLHKIVSERASRAGNALGAQLVL
jgi:hypothetical protein